MTIYTYLKEDHDQVKQLMEEIVDLSEKDSEKRNKLFNELKENLILHSKAEERAFYAPLKQFQQTQEEVEHGQEEHEEAEQLLKELTDGNLTGTAWKEKFLKLKEAVEHHIEEEENEIFEDAQKVIDDETARSMEEKMKELKEEEQQNLDIKKRSAA